MGVETFDGGDHGTPVDRADRALDTFIGIVDKVNQTRVQSERRQQRP